MNVIVLGPSYKKYLSASYQYAFEKELKLISSNFFHYSNSGDIRTEYIENKAGFIPDLIFYNHGWLSDDPLKEPIKFGNIIGSWTNKNIKHILMLNKEYSRLNEKIEEINNFNFDMVFTHLHNCQKLTRTNKKIIFMPLAYSLQESSESRFRKLNERKYDLFFSGILQNWNFKDKQSNIRKKIQQEIFYTIFDIPFVKKFKYRNFRIYWKPFYKSSIKNKISNILHGKRLNQNNYHEKLAESKFVLHTASPMGIISTRIFEALGSGAIGLFSKDSEASFLFKKNIDFIEFNDIKDLIAKLSKTQKISERDELQKIASKGRVNAEENHTWSKRAKFFLNNIKK
jgi:hypothetical protein